MIGKNAIIRRKNDKYYGIQCTIVYDYKTGINPVVVEFKSGIRHSYEYYDLDIE